MPGMTGVDLIGHKFLNRYKVVSKIGGGGMSVVWKAYDLVLDRFVALKVLRPEMSEDEDFIRRFRREAQSAASLSHPNIVNIFDVGQDGGVHFIVMELIEGQTLRDRLKKLGRLSVKEALEIAAQICEGLSHAHARRIIHRDIKPQNILLTKSGLVKVTDFGIARALGGASYTSRDVVVGSAPYLSPEQAQNTEISVRSDLYSLGVVLYEMLEGAPPYGGDSPISIAYQHVEAEIPSLKKKRADIPDQVDALVRKALAKDPEKRFTSATEMLKAIRALQSSDDKVSPVIDKVGLDEGEAGGDERLPRGQKKRRQISLGTKVLLGFLAIVLGLGAYALYLFNHWMNVPIIEVPNVVGMTQTQAQAELRAKGFIPQLSAERYDESIPAGQVISQSPLGGELAKEGREVYYVISKGQEYSLVPYLTGKSQREAELELSNAGLVLGRVSSVYHVEVPEGRVVSQNPKAGLDVRKGLSVDIEVSMGPEPENTVVPNVVGLPIEEARELIKDALLAVDRVIPIESDAKPGIVLSQSPEADAQVPVLSKVTLMISEGRYGQGEQVYPLSISVPKGIAPPGSLVNVKVILEDARGTNTVFEMNLSPGSVKTIDVEWQGSSAVLQVWIGDKKSTIELH
jgi:beta-lactam-binding protein with PASTA domain